MRPKRHVAVLACMDSRILFEHCLGLKPGDAHMIRNAGGIATDDALRSLIVSHHLLDTQEFIIINHTDCGLLKVREDELKARLTEKMGTAAEEPSHFHAFDDLEANVRQQMHRVKSHPWIPKHIPVRGFVYDVKTGKLKEVEESRLCGAGALAAFGQARDAQQNLQTGLAVGSRTSQCLPDCSRGRLPAPHESTYRTTFSISDLSRSYGTAPG